MKQVLYIFMRNDLFSMNAGKAMAQASHASAQFIKEIVSSNNKLDNKKYFDNWRYEGDGFGTTIVLEGSLENIKNVIKKYANDYCHGDIIDTIYPFKAQKELLDLMDEKTLTKYNINICADASVDNYGMIACTRIEHTCSWLFLTEQCIEHKVFEDFKKLCDENNIKLHK